MTEEVNARSWVQTMPGMFSVLLFVVVTGIAPPLAAQPAAPALYDFAASPQGGITPIWGRLAARPARAFKADYIREVHNA